MLHKIKTILIILMLFISGGNLISCGNDSLSIHDGAIYVDGKPLEAQTGEIYMNRVKMEGEFALIYSEPLKTDPTGWFVWCGTELPFIAVLKAYGFDVGQVDDDLVKVTANDRVFTINLKEKKVMEEGGSNDFIRDLGLGGGWTSYSVRGQEIFFDYATIKGFFRQIGENLRIEVDVNALRVDVTF